MKDETPPMSLRTRELPREGELFDNKYRIGTMLGIGGMAAVVGAKHLGFDEMVAIKILLPEVCDDPAVVERFVQEGKTAIKIRSEHVVRMLDVGVVAGRAYLVMEHLVGKDLDALVREAGPLPVDVAVDMLLQACEAIGEAHVIGIIHRDLKPANLFLTHRADGTPCVKVLDFGISKMPKSLSPTSNMHLTLPSLVMGSPQYMSPEQMTSAATVDPRSDIWSLGTLLYELLTGHIAFDGASMTEVCARVLQGAPVPLVDVRADVSPDLAVVIARCLEKDRTMRYANVAELARALAPFGSASARASAESIARIVEGVPMSRSPSWSESGISASKPTAAEILATVPQRRSRMSGYLMGALLAFVAIGIAGGTVFHRSGTFDFEWPLASGAAAPLTSAEAPGPMPVAMPVATSLATALVAAAIPAPSAEASAAAKPKPAAPPVKRHHVVVEAVPAAAPVASTKAVTPAPASTDDDNDPYTAP
jgi:serine/threonine protein kinase